MPFIIWWVLLQLNIFIINIKDIGSDYVVWVS